VTLRAPEFAGFVPRIPDEYLGLYMPAAGAPLVLPPGRDDPRMALTLIAERERPALRWYTVRHHRPDLGEIDVDIVATGHPGPGATWLAGVMPGDEVGILLQDPVDTDPEVEDGRVLVADESAVPALLAMLEAASESTAPVHAYVELPDERFLPAEVGSHDVRVVLRGGEPPGSALMPELSAAVLGPISAGWICGEADLVRRVRRHLTQDLGVPVDRLRTAVFWILGRPRP